MIFYKYFISQLNIHNIDYILFKGLEKLQEKSFKPAGDIDLYIDKNSYEAFDKLCKRIGLLFVDDHELKTRKCYFNEILEDRIYMVDVNFMLPMKITRNKIWYIKDFRYRYDEKNIDGVSIRVLPEQIRSKYESQYNDYKSKYLNSTFNNLFNSDYLVCKKSPIKIYIRLLKRLFGQPPNLCFNGIIVAIVGVDGSGKSTLINSFLSSEFWKAVGVKGYYFGFNNFSFPGVLELYKLLSKSRLPLVPYFRLFPLIIMNVERYLLYLKALYMRSMGNLVICDRFFFDDVVYYNENKISPLRRILRIDPANKYDLAIYLDVNPDVAFSRKKDFDYNKMIDVNSRYRNYMMLVEDCSMVDANKPHQEVFIACTNIILGKII